MHDSIHHRLNYEEENCSANRTGGRGKEERANKAARGPASQMTKRVAKMLRAAVSVQFVYTVPQQAFKLVNLRCPPHILAGLLNNHTKHFISAGGTSRKRGGCASIPRD